MLGYDLDAATRKLVVNDKEAERVRSIFEIVLETRSLSQTLEELSRRGWKTKSWTTQKGKARLSVPFDRPALVRVLTNVIYIGEVLHGGRRYPGEQPAIVDQRVWDRTNRLLDRRKRGESSNRERRPALLEGRLLCRICGRAMAHGYTANQGRHRYYRCQKARKTGANACPGQTGAAERIEYAVLARLAESTAELTPDLDKLVESIRYDHRAELATVKLKSEDSELSIIIRKDRSGRRYRLAHDGRLRFPRIAEVMALAIRFDQLFRDGLARNSRELAARVGTASWQHPFVLFPNRSLNPEFQKCYSISAAPSLCHQLITCSFIAPRPTANDS